MPKKKIEQLPEQQAEFMENEFAEGVGNPCCSNCLFSAFPTLHPEADLEMLVCRRLPPISWPSSNTFSGVEEGRNEGWLTAFPQVATSWWCGEFQPEQKPPTPEVLGPP